MKFLLSLTLLLTSCGVQNYESKSVEASNGLGVPLVSTNKGGALSGSSMTNPLAEERASKAESFHNLAR